MCSTPHISKISGDTARPPKNQDLGIFGLVPFRLCMDGQLMIGFRFPNPRSWILAPESTGVRLIPSLEWFPLLASGRMITRGVSLSRRLFLLPTVLLSVHQPGCQSYALVVCDSRCRLQGAAFRPKAFIRLVPDWECPASCIKKSTYLHGVPGPEMNARKATRIDSIMILTKRNELPFFQNFTLVALTPLSLSLSHQ